jgi:hypothetical protein
MKVGFQISMTCLEDKLDRDGWVPDHLVKKGVNKQLVDEALHTYIDNNDNPALQALILEKLDKPNIIAFYRTIDWVITEHRKEKNTARREMERLQIGLERAKIDARIKEIFPNGAFAGAMQIYASYLINSGCTADQARNPFRKALAYVYTGHVIHATGKNIDDVKPEDGPYNFYGRIIHDLMLVGTHKEYLHSIKIQK